MGQESLIRHRIRMLAQEVSHLQREIMSLNDRFAAILAKVQQLQQETQPVQTDILSTAAETTLEQIENTLGLTPPPSGPQLP